MKHEGPQRTKQGDAPAAPGALHEIGRGLLETQREHDHDDPELCEISYERMTLRRQYAGVDHHETEEQEKQHRGQACLAGGHHGHEYGRSHECQLFQCTHANSS